MPQTLRGRRVVITGGTGGLGSAVVKLFADAGANCEVTPRGSKKSTASNVRYHLVDVADESAVVRFYQSVGTDLWASIHLVGAFDMAPIAQTLLAQFRA